MKKIIKNTITKTALILLIGSVIGILLLIGSFLLPTDRMEKNVKKSLSLLEKEDVYYQVIEGYDSTRLDNYTDALMLNNAIYNGKENVINKSMLVYRDTLIGNTDTIKTLRNFYTNEQETEKSTYSRYWHGYLVLLKPLLMLFDYSNIRMLNALAQTMLLVLVAVLMYKKNKEKYIIPYIFSMLMLSPFTVMLSLQFSSIFYITNLSVAFLLLYNDKLKINNNYKFLFLITGMVTSFFDFLTYPLVTFGIPIVMYLILREEKDFWKNIKEFIINGIMWAVGYIGFWCCKLAFGSLLTGENLFIDAIDQFKVRSSFEVVSTKISCSGVINKNFNLIANKPHLLLIILLTIYVIYLFIKHKPKINKNMLLKVIPFAIIAISPYVWYCVASNHSYMHAFFTYRIQIITVFALFSGIMSIIEKERIIKNENKRKRK